MGYANLISELPSELQMPLLRLVEGIESTMRDELAVRRSDFDELRGTVQELVTAQKRTDQSIQELTAAQKRTDQRLDQVDIRLDRLAAAQERTELRLNELAEAQKRTELRLNELAEAQKRTELRLTELAEAQLEMRRDLQQLTKRLDNLVVVVEELTLGLKRTREEVGGLAMTIGYTLENAAYKALPQLLAQDYGLIVEGRLTRSYLRDRRDQPIEVNILGTARRNGDTVTIIGESKAQLSKNNVDRFRRKVLDAVAYQFGQVFPILITHMISEPDVEAYAKEQNIAIYYSYDF